MKTKIAKFLTLAAMLAGSAGLFAADGDIYEITACDATGTAISQSNWPIWPRGDETLSKKAGQTAYFKLRLAPRETTTGKVWYLKHVGLSSLEVDKLYMPQIGVFVRGTSAADVRFATMVDEPKKVVDHTISFTEIIFSYTTEPGDFALPILLAAQDGKTVRPIRYTESAPTYYFNPNRTAWTFSFDLQNGTTVYEPTWAIRSAALPDVSRVLDTSLASAGYNVQTVDFSSTWETNDVVWRSVHKDTAITIGSVPQLVMNAASDKAVTLYVWSTNEANVIVSGPNVSEVECDPEQSGKKFHVAKITIGAGETVANFNIRGVSQTDGGWSGLVLSSFDKFNEKTTTGEIYDDYIVVPVRCVDPLPPSVIVETDRSIAYATNDYKKCAARLTLRLSQSVSTKFKVRLHPRFSESPLVDLSTEQWGEYVRFSSTLDEVSALPDPTDATTEVELGGGVDSATLFVYALRGDEHTSGSVNEMEFHAYSEAPPTEITDWGKAAMQIVAQYPEIVEPEEGATVEAVQFDETPVTIRVSDTYADMSSDDGYKIYVKYYNTDAKFVPLDGSYKPGEGGILERVDDGSKDMPKLTYDTTGTFENETLLYIVAPVSGKKSCGESVAYRKLTAVVTPTKSISVTTTDGTTDYNEDDTASIQISLSETTKQDVYAFLKIMSDDVKPEQFSSATPFVVGMTNSQGKCLGLKIGRGKSAASLAKLKLLDGYGPGSGEYLTVDFEVVLATVQDYDKAVKEKKLVSGYESDILTLTVNNVEPEIKYIELASTISESSGYNYPFQLPRGQSQTIKAKIDDVKYDLNNRFRCRWTPYLNGTPQTTAIKVIEGNPDENPFVYDFPTAGNYRILLQVLDKDMDDDWSAAPSYDVNVTVIKNPGITVEPMLGEMSVEELMETETKASVSVGLTYYDANTPLYVKLTVEPVKAGTTDKVGELILDTSYRTPPAAGLETGDNIYYLTFESTDKQTIAIEQMDGTDMSDIYGFYIKAEVVNDTENPKTGEKWCEYYIKNLTTKIHLKNDQPNKGDESVSFAPEANTNAWNVSSLATSHPLTWKVRSEVDLDWKNGVTISIDGGGGSEYNDDGFVKGEKTVYEPTSGTYIADFVTSGGGEQQVTITIKDKDGAYVSRTWLFNVEESRILTTTAIGPGSQAGVSYTSQGGIGQGHVFVHSDVNTKYVTSSLFSMRWNCSSLKSVQASAWGYKVDDPEDDGTLNGGYDIAINGNGSRKDDGEAPYTYFDKNNRDSFLYAWQLLYINSEGTEITTNVFALEKKYLEGSEWKYTTEQALIPLNTIEKDSSNGTTVEQTADYRAYAIFSKEYYPTDNMGDINFDRIPDLYHHKYTYVASSQITTQGPGGNTSSQTEQTEFTDVSNISSYNNDLDIYGVESPDFLPSSRDSILAGFKYSGSASWLTNGTPFIAEYEIRGFGQGLNDGPGLSGLENVTSERRYTDPATDTTSTLSEVEYLAWCEYAAVNGLDSTNADDWEKWSPERPSDPTLYDTDGDGFPDGFEYFFWYRAHVGYIDANGNHRYETGRRFNPRNPGEGDLITSAEIEAVMDPVVAWGGADASTQDSDNDGLPDLLELTVGTNPFDFDTDGDGLPDGWEVIVSDTDPTNPMTDLMTLDSALNRDGDAMAITSPLLEQNVMPLPRTVPAFTVFATVDPDGDSDGVQWYASAGGFTAFEAADENFTVVTLADGTTRYATTAEVKVCEIGEKRLAATLDRRVTFLLDEDDNVLMPAYVQAGTLIASVDADQTCHVNKVTADVADENTLFSCWIYGRNDSSASSVVATPASASGFLALGRPLGVASGTQLCCLPTTEIDVAYLHYLVYQAFGFDPRTAWKATSPLAARWNVTGYTDVTKNTQGGYVANSTRTRAYTALDEFLVMSFFLNNGTLADAADIDPESSSWANVWLRYTTNPRGPGEEVVTDETLLEDAYALSDNGADTDGDGVPDGWELYIMSGPAKDGKFVYAPPRSGFDTAYGTTTKSHWSPFVSDAQSTDTDNEHYIGSDNTDNLTEFREFGGTDTIAYYTEVSSNMTAEATIVRATEDASWINKFFPTDPWNGDTDGDGVKDADEGSEDVFVYGAPVDNGKLWSVPGGGLNPCSVDTDLDGLPDEWEKQFKGKTIYSNLHGASNFDPTYAAGLESGVGNPLEGLVDGMDGTVMDAYTIPSSVTKDADGNRITVVKSITQSDGRVMNSKTNRDYDHDGLENWQEYLVGAMRCWRYDDPYTPFTAIPYEAYYKTEDGTNYVFDAAYAAEKLGVEGEDEDSKKVNFWQKTLFDPTSPIYNPYLITDTSIGAYFSRVDNVWDLAYIDPVLDSGRTGGAYYIFKDKVSGNKIQDLWVTGSGLTGGPLADIVLSSGSYGTPTKYISCSPIDYDSDGDGMDDYYELFHGMNPLLGASGVLAGEGGPCDLVFDAWAKNGNGFVAYAYDDDPSRKNYWQLNPWKAPRKHTVGTTVNDYDFEVYPWLTGVQSADPDGDGIINRDEAIMPLLATETWHHSDPTPLWQTDSSYSNSLVRLFYRLPARFADVAIDGSSITAGEATVDFTQTPAYYADGDKFYLGGVIPDFWNLSKDGCYNWIASFEENEGFDTDHDGVGDFDEAQGNVFGETDLLDADDPLRHQAMYFPGENSALQTLPTKVENYPVYGSKYPDDMAFRTYTVEAWVNAEDLSRDQVIVERAVWVNFTNVGDPSYKRSNFQLAIKDGFWYTKFDPSGTERKPVAVFSQTAASTGWTHLAATFDGAKLEFYVNGVQQKGLPSTLAPEYGASAMALYKTTGMVEGGTRTSRVGDFWFDNEYKYTAIVVGAGFRDAYEGGDKYFLDVSRGMGWAGYKDFFKGYVDEIRIWDGARSADDIISDFSARKRYSRTEALENQQTFWKEWKAGSRRYAKDDNGDDVTMTPELRYHFAFDSVFGAADLQNLAVVPNGFCLSGGKAIVSRPDGYQIDWWKNVLAGYGSAYAGVTNYVNWIPNTVAHLPRYDGTTLDSMFWSENFKGWLSGTYKFTRTAEPVSRWSQIKYNALNSVTDYGFFYITPGSRHYMVNDDVASGSNTAFDAQFEFTGRNLRQFGDDLLPLGGAFVKYCESMWDDGNCSSVWETTGSDADGDGLPDWWEEYVRNNTEPAMKPGAIISWDTVINYRGVSQTAGEAYLKDIWKYGIYHKGNEIVTDDETFVQVADSNQNRIPDWWEFFYKIFDRYGENEEKAAYGDLDHDGLSNYNEYLVSEVLPFGMSLSPVLSKTDSATLDYFRTYGKLYLGEMLTDHDLMEDSWERELDDDEVASENHWDALKDADEDGWTNFEENRYNGFSTSIMAQLASHTVGDAEVLDAPVPTLKLTLRYNGSHLPEDSATKSGSGETGSALIDVGNASLPPLVVMTYTDADMMKKDATFSLSPGTSADRSVYLGGWEERTVHGTLTPGHIELDSLDIRFAQVPQSNLYSWTDPEGTHIARPYSEFKKALDNYPVLVQNIQDFEWTHLVPATGYDDAKTDKAITFARDSKLQFGYIAVYGEQVGTVNLETGEFAFDMVAFNKAVPKTASSDSANTNRVSTSYWSTKEAIFRIDYTARIPSVQTRKIEVSLAQADSGYVMSGTNSIAAFYDLDKDGAFDPGEPFGIARNVEVGWNRGAAEIELTDTSAITPRISLWSNDDDRSQFWPVEVPTNDAVSVLNVFTHKLPTTIKSRVRVARYMIDGWPVYSLGPNASQTVIDKTFDQEARNFLHEGDFLADGEMDLDWNHFQKGVYQNPDVLKNATDITNISYLVVFGDGATCFDYWIDSNTVVNAHSTIIERRFEGVRHAPVAIGVPQVIDAARPTFRWTLANEDQFAARYGTTYTAFKVKVWGEDKRIVYDSGYQRMPACDADGVYSWTAPLYVDCPSPSGKHLVFENLKNYTWQVFVYNAKFQNDANGSEVMTFRMNVTEENLSTFSIPLRVCYSGPGTNLVGKLHVEAYENPDFSGFPAAAAVMADSDKAHLAPDYLGATNVNVKLVGLAAGTYYLRAFIDTNGNYLRDEWESWGYLNERDIALVKNIFEPVSLLIGADVDKTTLVRQLYIEDCDTDLDYFPDIWEAEKNGNVFDYAKIGPVTGDAELIGVNPTLTNVLNQTELLSTPAAQTLKAMATAAAAELMVVGSSSAPSAVTLASGQSAIAVEADLDNGSVSISEVYLNDEGKVVIKVASTVEPKNAGIYLAASQLRVTVLHTATLGGKWTEATHEDIVVTGAEDLEFQIDAGAKDGSGFYKVTIEDITK